MAVDGPLRNQPLALALLTGYRSMPVALVHHGTGLAVRVRFRKKHGFTWCAVDDPDQHVALSKVAFDEWKKPRHNRPSADPRTPRRGHHVSS